ncbi:iron-containing redox enzyme family protein [Solwaraspora sp. WMMD406]|uniref:iron-containing redox enzyme family protein n=1 Tax=Solwaraspora sp. WMMD406 TaxID=3016095 RepID=UPI002417F2EE|nr:iron-containing redox enzyme family protein [Solwaraspora sp. WMMD406]MDG4767443.1 iron-containing redox enzyme family protein [Solwaraspora sp. WMMD406]
MDGLDARGVYAYVFDPELLLPPRWADEIDREVTRLAGPAPGPTAGPAPGPTAGPAAAPAPSWDELVAEARQELDRVRQRQDALWRQLDERTEAVLVRRAVVSYAPIALIGGAWLQWLSDPSNADEALTMQVLALYANDVGVGRPRAARGSAYLTLLRHLSCSENAVPTTRLTIDPRVPDSAFYLPALLLAMSRMPDRFRPEILGADLYLRAVGLPPALAEVRRLMPNATDWDRIDTSASLVGIREAVDLLGVDGTAGPRVASGFRWAAAADRRFAEEILADLTAARDPGYEMAELLRNRAREGLVYHQQFQLAGRSLSDWLADARTDPGPLMAALAGSKLVKPGRSAASPLVSGLVGERGPMFRVFSPEDLAVLRRWIDALPAESLPVTTATVPGLNIRVSAPAGDDSPVTDDDSPTTGRTGTGRTGPRRGAMGLRDAYHQLVRRVDTPQVRRFAQDYVAGWLARSAHDLAGAVNQLPARWGPEGLRPWLQEQHDRHAAEFDSGGTVPSREDLVDATVQLAPLTLIDGAWLQGFTDYELASSEYGHFLFETYWDELGNGELKLNHPLIYREVLDQMGVRLPPTGSPEFAHSPVLRDESFELPVYWLSVGRLARTHVPEILGLNVAMELSGVGGSYRRARIALKEYGFSTRFVDIHNTIDNVATGHSAWAADAVDTYLGAIATTHGAEGRDAAWARVRVGYRSLNPPSDFWARRAQRRAQRANAGRR